jgi:broad specificity phosphatase PhoE
MSVRLTLICHAGMPAPGTVAFFQDEPADPGQLARAAGMTPALGRVARLWTAPERRTRQTAEILGPDATIMPALRDCDFGRWQGRRLDEIGAQDPEGVAAWLADMASVPHGGESLLGVLGRVGELLDGHREPGHTVAVTHPAVIRAAIVHSLGAPPRSFWRIDVEPLAAADLRHNNGRWTLRSIGRTFLP